MLQRSMSSSDVEICLCDVELRPELLGFLSEHWGRDHVFVRRPELLDWQYLEQERGAYNFVVALNREERRIRGVLGFIPVWRYDEALEPARHIWLALWKVVDPKQHPGLGVKLLRHIENELRPSFIGAMGLNDEVVRLYRHLGFTLGRTRQHVILNSDLDASSRRLAQGELISVAAPRVMPGARIRQVGKSVGALGTASDEALATTFPHKSLNFFVERYFRHPFYDYEVHLVESNDRPMAAFATRTVQAEGRQALRIVDFVGDERAIVAMGAFVGELIRERGYEYADFVEYGVDNALLAAAGFTTRNDASIVIPHFFEPLVRKNHDLWLAFKPASLANVRFFKADADQDRPNLRE